MSILPYAVGASSATGTPLGLVTYSPAGGIRILNDATEYTASLTAAAPTHNVRLSGTFTNGSEVTVNALVLAGTTTVNGAGTIRITSGALLKAPAISTAGTIANSLDFGAAEASVFVGNVGDILLLYGAIAGSGGLTKSGDGALRLSGANSFTGPLTINAGDLQFASLTSLGQGTGPIAINGHSVIIGGNFATTGLTYTGTNGVTLARNLHLNGGLASLRPGAGLTIGGTISGNGGLWVSRISSADGYVVLPNANSYAGPTVIDGPLAIASDASLGHGSSVTLRDTLRLDGPLTSARTFEIGGFTSTIDTNGFDAALHAPIIDGVMAGTNTRRFTKSGTGTLTLTKDSPFSGRLIVSGGTLLLTDAGRLAASEISVGGTGDLRLNNSTVVSADRISDGATISLSGKGLTLIGHANVPVTEKLGSIGNYFGADLVTDPGNTGTVLSLNIGSAGQRIVFRGDALAGGPAGAFTRVRLGSGTTLTNGLLPAALADASSTGSGNSFATYDTTVDAAGIIGVRPLRASEYVSGPLIRNPANGGATPVAANYLIDGSTTTFGASNAVNSLTFAGTGRLTLGAGQRFDMTNTPGILTQIGATAVIEGGNIITSNAFTGIVVSFHLQGDGDLTLRNTALAPLPGANPLEIVKLGAGALTLDGARITDPIKVRNGTLRLAPGDGVGGTQFTLDAGTTLALTGASARIGSLEGAGSVLLGAGELTLGRGTFDGAISGSGGLCVSLGSGLTLRSPASYSGPTRIEGSGATGFALTGSGSALLSSKFVISGGGLNLGSLGSVASRIGVVPIELNSGAITLNGDSTIATRQSAGLLTSSGLSQVSVLPFGSTGPLTHLEFSGIERVDRGAFSFILGSGANANARITFGSAAMAALIGAGTNPTNRPVLPFAVSGNSLITYDPVTGVRLLDSATEISNTLVAGSNVRLNGTTTLASDIAINSLISSSATVNGPGTLTVSSGVILGAGVISAPVNFGNAEAHLYGPNFPNVLSLTGPISGSNGVTITAAFPSATIELGGQNTFTGPLTVNAGILRFFSAANLGVDPSAIVISDARIEYAGGGAFSLARPLRLNGSSATLAASGTGRLTIAEPITGTGGLLIQGDVVLTATNTYTGTTNVEGKLTIPSDAALGSGPLRLARRSETLGLLTLAGPWTTSRTVEVGVTTSPSPANTIDTAGFDATLNGPLTSGIGATSSLVKIGAGTLTIADASAFTSDLAINGGTVAVNSTMPVGGTLTVGANGTLAGIGDLQRTVTVNGTLSPGDAGPGTLSTAGVNFANGSTFAIELMSASSFDQARVSGTATLNGTINLALLLGFDPADGLDSFVILANDAADAIMGTGRFAFAGNLLEEDETFFVGAQAFQISYAGGTGNDVVLDAVPEPVTSLLLFVGSVLLGAGHSRNANRCRKVKGLSSR